MKENILISIVIPAHNEEKTIGHCLDLIVDQTKKYKDKIEIIVVNDGSNDKTPNIVKSYSRYNVRLLNFETGHSAAFSRNRGSEVSKGKYIFFLDADQLLEKGFIDNLIDMISKKDFEGLSFFVFPYNPRTIFQKAWAGYRKAHLCRGFIFKRNIFNKLKFDERLFYIEDNDLWERFEKAGYKLVDTGLKIYHIDTETLGDFVRQRKWHGKGILCGLKIKKNPYFLRYFFPCALLLLGIITFWPLIAYLVIIWLFYTFKSKDPFYSFLWVTVDYIGRFISLFYFAKELIIIKPLK
jgi:glycosyltransferase involved in cell wall biosynthesis